MIVPFFNFTNLTTFVTSFLNSLEDEAYPEWPQFLMERISSRVYEGETLFLPVRQTCSVFSGAGNFCRSHGLRQLTRDVKMMSEIYILEVTSHPPPQK